MTKYRFLVALFPAALAALFALVGYLFNLPLWLIISPVILLLGFWLGLLWQRRRPVARGREYQKEDHAGGIAPIDLSADLIDATVNEMREGLLVIDAEMRVVASNRAARDLFSHLNDRINLRTLTEVTRNPAVYDAFLDGVRGTERAGVKVETYGPTKKVFDLRVVPLRTGNGREAAGAVGVFFDITRLERLELVRQEFLSNVSHELRTPLTSIMALSETLEAGAIDDQQHNRRFLGIIQKNAARMHRLIDDILELSAIEAGNVKVNSERVGLFALVEDVTSSLSSVAAARGISLRNLVGMETEVFADPHRLVQMLTNLIENAIKFNREGGSVSIRCDQHGGDRISVEDTGEGIPAHHLDRLFERFYRVDRARSRELGGTGLGLAIVKHLARAHGGEVTVQSRFGEGTNFTIELPGQNNRA
ncbi:MAG: two-component system, OmpR family, phosphate regulon sensor histidine kinase PhoR [Blastocatellia bacterium]|jgi:two-component system phosphate regulon sensor histidine kinase PhoR|nr:two-component system, OmpR family, phosphate regulon sensor histidine kinase PhoR [Blastocatellia bacterium]